MCRQSWINREQVLGADGAVTAWEPGEFTEFVSHWEGGVSSDSAGITDDIEIERASMKDPKIWPEFRRTPVSTVLWVWK